MKISDGSQALIALLWYLYRSENCPMGDNWIGFHVWIKTAVLEPLEQLQAREES